MHRASSFFLTCLASVVALAAACDGSSPASPSASPVVGVYAPIEPNPPAVYVAKVKNLLVGLPPTKEEIQAVNDDPTQLDRLVRLWMTYPQYDEKMLRFFELAFQQTQVSITSFADQVYPRVADANTSTAGLLAQNATESFARTVLQQIAEGRPFTEAMTTQSFVMTTALMELYAFLDSWQVDDDNVITDLFAQAHPGSIVVEASAGPIPQTDAANPESPDFMHWYDPDVAKVGVYEGNPACNQDPIVYPANGMSLQYLIFGSLDARRTPEGVACPVYGGTASAPQVSARDFADWRTVTIRAPFAGEAVTPFYDLPSLRTSGELVLTSPRVGFFTTPAFFANWQTNSSNQMRVVANQALIVALGAQIDGTDSTIPPSTPGLDSAHASSSSAGGATPCITCHQLLDPTRSIFAASYSWNYHQQTDPAFAQQDGLFAFEGVVRPVASLLDFGNVLASHPLFATAWTQKLCYYVDSAPCDPSDPEFQRIAKDFAASSYSFPTLVRELVTSPLTTYAATTKTASENGEVVAVSRRDHLCASLDERLGLQDVCGLLPTTTTSSTSVPKIAVGLPSDGYGRGSTAPVLPNQPSLFYRAGIENICSEVAGLVIDPPSASAGAKVTWSSTQPYPAIADFVSLVMGLPPSPTDTRSTQVTAALEGHFQAALLQGASPSDALKSTFTAACMAPSAISMGL